MTQSPLLLPDFAENIERFTQGVSTDAYRFLGCQPVMHEGISGYQFSVWAPNAAQVHLQGDFSNWEFIPMTRVDNGIWVVFSDQARKGQHYKYAIDNGKGHIEYKIDPFGFRFEEAPKDATIVWDLPNYEWNDSSWMRSRARKNAFENPMVIYEVHPSSWRKHSDGRNYSFHELAETLIPYVKEMGYTHIELMPLMDHPLEASWGYQVTGYYAVSARYGIVDDLHYFIDQAHQANIGVFMDWVPGHFSRNANALSFYDGTPTFEYQDTIKADNVSWGALNFDLGKPQVQSFLISNALFWLGEFHLDGLRVDSVSNVLYLDFDQGPWTPNEDGSNHNREGVAFIKKLNQTVKDQLPGVLMMAEESTNWQGVTAPVESDGLGFDYKWNMGWMNDTLKFFEMDPLFRPQNLHLITFVFMYQYNEKYILPYSHDEVVHGKHSLLGKIPGDRYQQFATLRLIYGYMVAQPGKVLNFMGNEIGQFLEWRYYSELEWDDLNQEFNQEYQHFVKTVNQINQDMKALYQCDHVPEGITVLNGGDTEEGKLSFIRQGKHPRDFLLALFNFVPVQRDNVRVGVPYEGTYEVILNSEMEEFGGTWTDNLPLLQTEEIPVDGQPYSIEVIFPSLAVLYIKPKRVYGVPKK